MWAATIGSLLVCFKLVDGLSGIACDTFEVCKCESGWDEAKAICKANTCTYAPFAPGVCCPQGGLFCDDPDCHGTPGQPPVDWEDCEWANFGENGDDWSDKYPSLEGYPGEGIFTDVPKAIAFDSSGVGALVIMDVDDTITCSGGFFGGDKVCSGTSMGHMYPGVAEFALAVARGPANSVQPSLVVPSSARPDELSAFVAMKPDSPVGKAFAAAGARQGISDWGLDCDNAMYGSIFDLRDVADAIGKFDTDCTRFDKFGSRKYHNWQGISGMGAKLGVFIGDNGQGDAVAAQMMLKRSESMTDSQGALRAAFIHDVMLKCTSRECQDTWAMYGIYLFSRYADAAMKALSLGIISREGCLAVCEAENAATPSLKCSCEAVEVVTGFTKKAKSCVSFHNLGEKLTDQTPERCAEACQANTNCLAFEFGADYGGNGYQPGDCILNDGIQSQGCDGSSLNLDLYLRNVPGYQRMEKSCVSGRNLANFTDMTPQECANLCDARNDCRAFEYGMNYGGSFYKVGDCTLQSWSDSVGCSGATWNLDLYIKIDLPTYTRHPKACVVNHNIRKYTEKTRHECSFICDVDPDCRAFEFGVNHGGAPYQPGDCIPNDSAELTGCDGASVNLNLFTKNEAFGYDHKPKSCVRGHNIEQSSGITIAECAIKCDGLPNCVGFEYGMRHGGSPYNPGDCLPQDAIDTTNCQGAAVNLDFWQQIPVTGYTHTAQACVRGHNLELFVRRTRQACADLCNNNRKCVAFEYGMQHGGAPYKPGDCILNDSSDSVGCNGVDVNLDLFVKKSYTTTVPTTQPTTTPVYIGECLPPKDWDPDFLDAPCSDCKAKVHKKGDDGTHYRSCDMICEGFGHVCTHAGEDKTFGGTCEEKSTNYRCSDDIGSIEGTSDFICQCKYPELTTTRRLLHAEVPRPSLMV